MINDLIFVLTHSKFNPLWVALAFALIGFLIGYFTWAKYAKQFRLLKEGAVDREPELVRSSVTPTQTPAPAKSPPPAPKPITDRVVAKAPPAAPTRDRVTYEPEPIEKPDGISLPKVGLAGAGLAGLGALAHKFTGEEDKIEVDKELGVLYKERPDHVDDLTELDGIDKDAETRLNNRGIYTFKQLEAMDDDQRVNFGKRFNLPSINWDGWKSKLGIGGLAAAGIGGIGAGLAGIGGAIKDTAGDVVDGAKDLVGLDDDPELGSIYTSRPDKVDDLTKLDGIDAATQTKLNENGIYTFKQLEDMDDRQRASFASRFDLPDINWDGWKSKFGLGGIAAGIGAGAAGIGAGIAGIGGAIKDTAGDVVDGAKDLVGLDDDPELGSIYTSRPDKVDDLTQLDGIDAATQAKLNENGIYTFKQLEDMDDRQRASFASRFDLPDINWDGWKSKFGLGAIAAGIGAGAAGIGSSVANVGDGIGSGLGKVGSGIGSGLGKVGDGIGSGLDKVGDTLSDAGDAIGDKVDEVTAPKQKGGAWRFFEIVFLLILAAVLMFLIWKLMKGF